MKVAAVAFVFAVALLVHLRAPFVRHGESVGAHYAVMARNHVRHGFGVTRGANLEVSSPDLSVYRGEVLRYVYPNRPPVSVLVTAAWFALFGASEAVLRLSLIAASLGALLAFHAAARRLAPPREALLATGVFAFMPLYGYFSVVAVHLVYALAFSLAAWACRLRWADGLRWRMLAGLFLALGCLSDWPAYYAALALAIDAFRSRQRAAAAGFLGVAAGAVALHAAHLAWVGGGDLVRRFVAAGAERAVFPNVPAFAVGEARELALYATVGVLVLAAAGARTLPAAAWLLALLGLDELVFARWAFVHDYLTYPLAPVLALAAARGACVLAAAPRGRWAVAACLSLAAAQAAWVTGNRLTRFGAYELEVRGGQAVGSVVAPHERALILFAQQRQALSWYADRWTAGVEPGEDLLRVHPSGGGVPVGDWAARFGDVDWVVFADPALVAEQVAFFRGAPPPEAFRCHGPDHPLRRAAAARATEVVESGPLVLYRMRR